MKYSIYYQSPGDENHYTLKETKNSFKEAKQAYNSQYPGYISNEAGKVLKRYK